jgi:hypothetical protein
VTSFIALFLGSLNHSSTIVCIGAQWNHSDLSGCTPRVGAGYGHFGALGVGIWFREAEKESEIVVLEPQS